MTIDAVVNKSPLTYIHYRSHLTISKDKKSGSERWAWATYCLLRVTAPHNSIKPFHLSHTWYHHHQYLITKRPPFICTASLSFLPHRGQEAAAKPSNAPTFRYSNSARQEQEHATSGRSVCATVQPSITCRRVCSSSSSSSNKYKLRPKKEKKNKKHKTTSWI
jgi:hypothetical protein